MAKLQRLTEVSVYTRNAKLAKEFYTKKIGLKVRAEDKNMGYLALGATKGGEDASLDLWQPDPKWGAEMYEQTSKSVGIVTGIGFQTSNLEKTVEQLAARGVKVEKDSDTFARFWDPDGNVLFVNQELRPKARRAGIQSISFATVAVRDEVKAGRFFKALGFKSRKVPGESRGEGTSYTVYQLGPKGTAIMPFAPRREMYENPGEFESDTAHIGEDTGIGIEVNEVYKLQDALLAKGIEFKTKAEEREWGSIAARVYDPDHNVYMLFEMKK
jgi:catechol 2,3-dioxygenase-like lactoylglutathione lyase family enzyme